MAATRVRAPSGSTKCGARTRRRASASAAGLCPFAITSQEYALKPRARQTDAHAQAGRLVLEPEGAVVEMRDSGREAQAESRTGLGAALLQPHEALDRVRAVCLGDTGPAVGDDQRDAIALVGGRDGDGGLRDVGA